MERNLRKERVGIVVSDKMDKTVVVAIEERYKHPLYKKIARREALQILIAQKIAMEHLYCIGIEMHVVAHLIERDM